MNRNAFVEYSMLKFIMVQNKELIKSIIVKNQAEIVIRFELNLFYIAVVQIWYCVEFINSISNIYQNKKRELTLIPIP